MSRKARDEDFFELDENQESQLDRLMSLLEDSEIEFTVKKVANGKSIILDNGILFRFDHDEELSGIEK